jgi:secreted PhoX family phosphatase
MKNRVHSFEVDVIASKAEYLEIVASVQTPDNILIDNKGRLIVALPSNNQVVGVDLENHSQHIIFEESATGNLKITKDLNNLLPGILTGMFFSVEGKTIYISNLGTVFLKYDFK